jgi:protein PsiE
MENGAHFVTKFAKLVQNVTLIVLLLILTFLMFRQAYSIGENAIYNSQDVHTILEQILSFFLYFAFFTTITICFKNGGHFPIRHLIYIGITATVRFIIVNRSDAMQNLLLSVVILLLIVGYILLTPKRWLFPYLLDRRRKKR